MSSGAGALVERAGHLLGFRDVAAERREDRARRVEGVLGALFGSNRHLLARVDGVDASLLELLPHGLHVRLVLLALLRELPLVVGDGLGVSGRRFLGLRLLVGERLLELGPLREAGLELRLELDDRLA